MHALVRRLAGAIDQLLEERPRVLVGIDGPDAAGKTTLADRLAAELPSNAVRASIDGFHNPIRVRHRRGRLSPEGYYRDAFNCTSVVDELLEPFAAGGASVATCRYDYAKEVAVRLAAAVPARSVLVFDGFFSFGRSCGPTGRCPSSSACHRMRAFDAASTETPSCSVPRLTRSGATPGATCRRRRSTGPRLTPNMRRTSSWTITSLPTRLSCVGQCQRIPDVRDSPVRYGRFRSVAKGRQGPAFGRTPGCDLTLSNGTTEVTINRQE